MITEIVGGLVCYTLAGRMLYSWLWKRADRAQLGRPYRVGSVGKMVNEMAAEAWPVTVCLMAGFWLTKAGARKKARREC